MKSQSNSPVSSKALHRVGRFYRWVAWIGVVATIFFTGLTFVTQWRDMSQYMQYYTMWEVARNALLASGFVFVAGLFMCGMAFLVSLMIEAGTRMLDNSHTQVDLMRQLVRQRSDVTSSTRLKETRASAQVDLLPHMIEEHQSNQRVK